MTNQAKNNYDIIYNLVSKYYSLRDDSLSLFKELLYDHEKRLEYIDPMFHSYLDEDLRAYFEIGNDIKIIFDESWDIFTYLFSDFLYFNKDVFNVSYENYLNNELFIDNKKYKLFKYAKKWYENSNEERMKDFCTYIKGYFSNNNEKVYINIRKIEFDISTKELFQLCFRYALEEIGRKKISNKKIYLVMSFNFSDWFFCSSGEKWSSCLNVESKNGSWASLPGLIVDKNRILFYITNKEKKEQEKVFNAEVDKMITRTWGLLDENDIIHLVRFYPSEIVNCKLIKSIVPFNIYEKSTIFKDYLSFNKPTKHPYNTLLYNKNNESIYIFQDKTEFKFLNNEELKIVKSYRGGISKIHTAKNDKKVLRFGFNYFRPGSLNFIIKNNSDVLTESINSLNYEYREKEEYKDKQCNFCGTYIAPEQCSYLIHEDCCEKTYCNDCYEEFINNN